MINTWPNNRRRAMSQQAHKDWNSYNKPGTLQLCAVCQQPTGRCEEDELVDTLGQPVCEECFDNVQTK